MARVAEIPNSTDLALVRTRLALERTLMAWVRTAASMISFGFTVYKFFQIEEANKLNRVPATVFTPRVFAIFLVSIGLVSLLAATIDHHRQLKQLLGEDTGVFSLAGVVATMVSVFGLIALVATILRA